LFHPKEALNSHSQGLDREQYDYRLVCNTSNPGRLLRVGNRNICEYFSQIYKAYSYVLNFRREKMALIPWDDGVLARLVPGLTK